MFNSQVYVPVSYLLSSKCFLFVSGFCRQICDKDKGCKEESSAKAKANSKDL